MTDEIDRAQQREQEDRERENFMARQKWMAETFLRPIFLKWMEAALSEGKLPKFTIHAWQGSRFQWVDPLRDKEACVRAIKSGLSTPQIIAAHGIHTGSPGECDLCGEHSMRLIEGACAPCRDRYHLP